MLVGKPRDCFFNYTKVSMVKVRTKEQKQRGEYAKERVYKLCPFFKKMEFALFCS